MCSYLLGAAAIATAILLLLGAVFGITFLKSFCCKNRDDGTSMPCYYHCCSCLSGLINLIINAVAFAYCLWLWLLMHNGDDSGSDEEGSYGFYALVKVWMLLWYLTKIFDLFIFNAKLKYTFIGTPYAVSKCMWISLQIMTYLSIVPLLFHFVIPLFMVDVSAVRLFRLLSPLLYFMDMVLVACAYGQKYRVIVVHKTISSMPQFQEEDKVIQLKHLTQFSLLTAMACKGAMFVWFCIAVQPFVLGINGNTTTLIAVAISLDAFMDTLSILMLYQFGLRLYNACCMFSREGAARKLSFHSIWDCFVRCTCCVPKIGLLKVANGDTYIDI